VPQPRTGLRPSPRFSVLIPTRDRPAYVRNALESVLKQSFGDFEVIVCDNFKERSCEAEVAAFSDPRIRYLRPPEPLAMHENWELAIDQARGDFVLILIDKTLLRLSALERLEAATHSHPADLYSWTADAYYLTDEAEGDVSCGYIVPVRGQGEPFYVDCAGEIAARVSFRQRLGTEGPAYAWGKICFGAYSRALIARIKTRFGKVCPLISPDYTSKTVALLSTDRLVDLNASYTVQLISSVSNGMLFSQDSGHARRFLAQGGFTEREFADLPIPHVFCSVHNICAYDWRMLDMVRPDEDYRQDSLDLAALYVQVERDLAAIRHWASDDERVAILGRMQAFLESAPVALRERILAFQIEAAETAPRENIASECETSVPEPRDAATDSERLFAPFLRVYRLLSRVRGFLKLQQASVAECERPTITTAPSHGSGSGPVVNGYPAFGTTLSALRYAETDHYTYPVPKPAPL
jgi:hypothetical protein